MSSMFKRLVESRGNLGGPRWEEISEEGVKNLLRHDNNVNAVIFVCDTGKYKEINRANKSVHTSIYFVEKEVFGKSDPPGPRPAQETETLKFFKVLKGGERTSESEVMINVVAKINIEGVESIHSEEYSWPFDSTGGEKFVIIRTFEGDNGRPDMEVMDDKGNLKEKKAKKVYLFDNLSDPPKVDGMLIYCWGAQFREYNKESFKEIEGKIESKEIEKEYIIIDKEAIMKKYGLKDGDISEEYLDKNKKILNKNGA